MQVTVDEPLTVEQLIELLRKEENQKRRVIIQSFPGSNSYAPLGCVWTGAYRPESEGRGTAGLEELTDEDRAARYTEEDVVEGEPALILTPM